MTPGSSFDIGGVDRRVADMAVAPGNAAALAVSRRVNGQSSGGGIALFVNGVPLPHATGEAATNNVVEFGSSANILYGHASQLSELDFNSFNIDLSPTGGVESGFNVKGLITSGSGMEFQNGRMYFTNGQVVNPTVPSPLGQFSASGHIEPDAATSRTFFLDGDKLTTFSQTTFVPLGEFTIPGFSGSAKNLISIGNGAFAAATSNDRIYIIRGIPGDFDANGTVGQSDYTIWKTTFGSTTDLRADVTGNNIVDAADYVVWRNNLGVTLTGGIESGIASIAGVPEPTSCFLLLLGVATSIIYSRLSH
jgi:hypothetical protein